MSDSHKPYTTGEVAAFCDVTINAVKKWIAAGKLPAFRTPGGHYRIERHDFKAFVEKFRLHIKDRSSAAAKKILIVDDEDLILTFITETLLTTSSDYIIETANDGYEALIKIGRFNPDVLILDIMMPRLDGFEVCRRLKAGKSTKDIKILAITAYGDDEKERIRRLGADVCLSKPLNMSDFLQSVRSLLG
ncbi:MAG: response regulator [Thermodesulfobacteriota bacterium]